MPCVRALNEMPAGCVLHYRCHVQRRLASNAIFRRARYGVSFLQRSMTGGKATQPLGNEKAGNMFYKLRLNNITRQVRRSNISDRNISAGEVSD
jgi:hypothetical protein